jgi:hypothetical protein
MIGKQMNGLSSRKHGNEKELKEEFLHHATI